MFALDYTEKELLNDNNIILNKININPTEKCNLHKIKYNLTYDLNNINLLSPIVNIVEMVQINENRMNVYITEENEKEYNLFLKTVKILMLQIIKRIESNKTDTINNLFYKYGISKDISNKIYDYGLFDITKYYSFLKKILKLEYNNYKKLRVIYTKKLKNGDYISETELYKKTPYDIIEFLYDLKIEEISFNVKLLFELNLYYTPKCKKFYTKLNINFMEISSIVDE